MNLQKKALDNLKTGFHFGGKITVSREALHEILDFVDTKALSHGQVIEGVFIENPFL
jgi:hypothetical protein